jgi:predicted nucleic acid-binding protein
MTKYMKKIKEGIKTVGKHLDRNDLAYLTLAFTLTTIYLAGDTFYKTINEKRKQEKSALIEQLQDLGNLKIPETSESRSTP